MLYRCRTRDLEDETKELKEKLTEVEDLLRRTEAQRQELERLNEFNKKEHSAALAAATTKVRAYSSLSWYGPLGLCTSPIHMDFKAEHVLTLHADHKICLEQSRLAISAGRKQSVDTLLPSDKAALLDNPYRHASSGSDVPYDLRKVLHLPISTCMF